MSLLFTFTLQWRFYVDLRWLHVWNGAVFALDEQRVRLHRCVCAWIERCYWRLMVIITCCPNTLQWRSRLYMRLLNGVMLALDKQRVCSHCCVRAWIRRRYYFWMQYEIVISPSRAVQIHYNNDDDGFALIFVRWMYGTGIVLALDEQNVRLHCCVVGV